MSSHVVSCILIQSHVTTACSHMISYDKADIFPYRSDLTCDCQPALLHSYTSCAPAMPATSKTAASSAAMKVMKAMKAMKVNAKPVMKKVLKRPASGKLSPKELDKLGTASLDDKIALYTKKGNGNIDSFLGSLGKEHRESLWQRFKYARQENAAMAKNYDMVAKGTKSMENKKALLNIFLQLGQSCKGQPYVDAITQLSFSKGSNVSQEWVPFATIMKKYGLQELMRRVQKGTVAVRSDPHDPEEYEFSDVRRVDTESTYESHSANVNRKDKISIEDYMKARSSANVGQLHGFSHNAAAQGFMASIKSGAKSTLALEDHADNEDEDGGETKSNARELEDKAELLTQFKNMGSKGKTASQRVDDMLDIMLTLLKKNPKTADKDVHAMINKRVLALQNLKKNKTLDLDSCKSTLMDAAATIKKVNKLR